MPDLNVTPSNAVRSVGAAPQKNTNNNTGRPNRTLENLQQGQNGRVSAPGAAGAQAAEVSYAEKLNEIREGFVKTINTDIIHKALRAADIEITQATLDIVNSLVNGSLPLTEKNIVDLLEYSRIFVNAPTDLLALMMRLEIPISAENIEQFEKLVGANEKLSDKITELINKLPQELTQNSRNLIELANNLSKLLDIVLLADAPEPQQQQIERGIAEANPQPPEPLLNRAELNGLLTMLRQLDAPESVISRIIDANSAPQSAEAEGPAYQTRADAVLDIIRSFITEQSERFPLAENRPAAAQSEDAAVFDKVKELTNSGAFQKLLKESIESRWLIDPKTFNSEKIEDFYNKLNESLSRIENRFARQPQPQTQTEQPEQNTRGERPGLQRGHTPAASGGNTHEVHSGAKSIRENLSLMNEISKTTPFMQIPIKLANQTANSDLYIFTNKKKHKNGKNPAGGINALLRLELDNLGSLDVYLNLTGKNVQSRFYSRNIKSVGEIAAHMPELEEIITEMGFIFKGVASSGEKGFDFVGDFINRGVPKAEVRKYILNLKI